MTFAHVSVIIPTHNRAGRVGEAIGSVLKQTYRDWELIVVDDGSTDGTAEVVRAFDDARISYVSQDNRGVSAARNRGIAEARGEFIAFLDSDDRWEPCKLEVQMAFFSAHPDAHICQTEEVWIRNGVRVNPRKKHAKPSGWIFKECLPLCVVSPSAVMIRRAVFDAIGLFDEALVAAEDYDLWLRASLHYEIATLPDALTIKVGGHDDQLSRAWGLDRWRVAALEKVLHNPALPPAYRPLVEDQIRERSRIVAEGARKRGNEELVAAYDQKWTPKMPIAEN